MGVDNLVVGCDVKIKEKSALCGSYGKVVSFDSKIVNVFIEEMQQCLAFDESKLELVNLEEAEVKQHPFKVKDKVKVKHIELIGRSEGYIRKIYKNADVSVDNDFICEVVLFDLYATKVLVKSSALEFIGEEWKLLGGS